MTGLEVGLLVALVGFLGYRLGCIIQVKRDNVTIAKALGFDDGTPWWKRPPKHDEEAHARGEHGGPVLTKPVTPEAKPGQGHYL